MNGSIFTTVLNNIQKYFEEKTPVTVYIPVSAFLGACFLVFIAVFGFEAPVAFWAQLPADLRVILIAALVFILLLLTYLTSQLRILITQVYQGLWPQIIDFPGIKLLTHFLRMRHIKKWRTLDRQETQLCRLEDECIEFDTSHTPPQSEKKIFKPVRGLPRYYLIRKEDLEPELVLERKIDEHGWITDPSALVHHYTLEPLSTKMGITRKQVCEGPPTVETKRSVVFVPLSPRAAPAAKAHLQPGMRITIFLAPNEGVSGQAKPFENVVVLAVTSAEEVVPGATDGSVTRELVVLTVALENHHLPEFFHLLPTHEATISQVIAPSDHESSVQVDLNLATAQQLEAIAWIGPVLAQRIVDYRRTQGPFGSISEIINVSGIGPSLRDRISDRLKVTPPENNPAPGNTPEELQQKLNGLWDELRKCTRKVNRFITKLSADWWSWPTKELRSLHDLSDKIKKLKQELDNHTPPSAVEGLKQQLRHLELEFRNLCGEQGDLHLVVMERREMVAEQKFWRFPGERKEQVQATELGNILLAVERYPLDNYGIETATVFSRLKDVLQAEATKPLVESKNSLDMLLLMSFLAWVFWLPASAVLALYTTNKMAFVLCSVGAPLLAQLCYKAALQAALDYGENLKSIYDLHRWKLLKQFNFVDLPEQLTLEQEKGYWKRINRLLEGDLRHVDGRWKDVKYKVTGG